MAWTVIFHDDLRPEVARLNDAVSERLRDMVDRLQADGPMLGRPHADTLDGSRHANMKELRFKAGGGEWRFAFAFDPLRRAIVLVGGDKSGVAQNRFYRTLISRADDRFDRWLESRR